MYSNSGFKTYMHWVGLDIVHFIRTLRARRALTRFKDVPLRTRRALSLHIVYGVRTVLVLNRTSLNSVNALLALSRRLHIHVHLQLTYIHVCSSVASTSIITSVSFFILLCTRMCLYCLALVYPSLYGNLLVMTMTN